MVTLTKTLEDEGLNKTWIDTGFQNELTTSRRLRSGLLLQCHMKYKFLSDPDIPNGYDNSWQGPF